MPPPVDAAVFIGQLQSFLLAAVLPAWTNPALATCSPLHVVNPVVNILNLCADGTLHAPARLLRQQPPARPQQPAPDAELVQQIAEMGFTPARAEEALRRVGHNSVELAMEWLVTHPEPEAPAADAAAEADGEGDAAARDEDVLESTVVAVLAGEGAGMDNAMDEGEKEGAEGLAEADSTGAKAAADVDSTRAEVAAAAEVGRGLAGVGLAAGSCAIACIQGSRCSATRLFPRYLHRPVDGNSPALHHYGLFFWGQMFRNMSPCL